MVQFIKVGFLIASIFASLSFGEEMKAVEKVENTQMKKSGYEGKMMSMNPEQRKKMADMHEKMAVCLRSEKTVEECHSEMMTTCKDTMGADHCPMMGGMMGGMMDHRGKMKKNKK